MSLLSKNMDLMRPHWWYIVPLIECILHVFELHKRSGRSKMQKRIRKLIFLQYLYEPHQTLHDLYSQLGPQSRSASLPCPLAFIYSLRFALKLSPMFSFCLLFASLCVHWGPISGRGIVEEEQKKSIKNGAQRWWRVKYFLIM